jgi:hypothetical protein
VDERGRIVDVSPAERDGLMLRDRKVRLEVLK